MVKHKAHGLLDVFPMRPNQKVVSGQDLLNTPRSTRSAGTKNLFTMCPYANTIVAYDSTNSEPKTRRTRNSYSPDPRNTTIALVDSSSSGNTASKPVRSKSVMPKTSKRPTAQTPALMNTSQALPPQGNALSSSVSNGTSPNDGNNSSTNNSPERRRAVSVAPSSMPKGLRIAPVKRSRPRAPAPRVSATLARTPEPVPADVPGPSSPPRRAHHSTSDTTVRNAPAQQLDPVFPSMSAIPKGLKVMAPKRSRSRAQVSKDTPPSIVPPVGSPPLTTATVAVMRASLESSSPDRKKRDVEDNPEVVGRVPDASSSSNTPKVFERAVAPKRSRSRAPTSMTSSSSGLPQVASSPSAGDVLRAPTHNNVKNTPKRSEHPPFAPMTGNTQKEFEKEIARKRPRSGGPPPRVSASSATVSSPKAASSISCTPEPASKMAKIELATTPIAAPTVTVDLASPEPAAKHQSPVVAKPTAAPTVIVELASPEPAAKHQSPGIAQPFSSAPIKTSASAVAKAERNSTLNVQNSISSQFDASSPSLTSSPIQVKAMVGTQSSMPGNGPLSPKPDTAHPKALSPKPDASIPSPMPKVPTPKQAVVSKPVQSQAARSRSVVPQLLNQSPGRPSGAVRAVSVAATKKVADVAPKAARKRPTKNQRRRGAKTPPQEPENMEIDQNMNSPPVQRQMVFFPLTSVFDSSMDTTFKELHYTPRYARRKDTAIVSRKYCEVEKSKCRSPVAVDVASLYKRPSCPLFVFGKLAIQYENFDYTDPCRIIKNLACFHEEHENHLIPVFKLGDWEMIKNLDEGTAELFYKNEMIPAIENWRKFNEDPTGFFDIHKDQYERHLEEDGLIYEYPLPPRPEVFPSQIRKRMSLDMQNAANRRSEARARREARAHDAAIAAAMEQQRLAAAAAAAEIPMMHIHNHLDNLAAYHHQQMMNQMFMPQPFFYQPPPPPTPPGYPPNNMFYPGMNFQPPPMQFDPYFNNDFPMHEFNLQ